VAHTHQEAPLRFWRRASFSLAMPALLIHGETRQTTKAGDLTYRPPIRTASQLRDSAGFAPASLLAPKGTFADLIFDYGANILPCNGDVNKYTSPLRSIILHDDIRPAI
jgi:hypothetical protein